MSPLNLKPMTTVAQYTSKVKVFRQSLPDLVEKAVFELESYYLDLIRSQWKEGRAGDDGRIIPAYKSSVYAGEKQSMNSKPSFGVPDLYLTGKFYRSLFLSVFSGELIVETKGVTDSEGEEYGNQLLEKYDTDGNLDSLTQENRGKLRTKIFEILRRDF